MPQAVVEDPMNRLSLARRTQIIGALVEGCSIRSTERMTDTHRDTVMRLMIEVGTGCEKLMSDRMHDLRCKRLQVDEIWSFVGKKQRHVMRGDDKSKVGDQWTFVAIDAQTKLVPCFRVGKRTKPHATDLSERLGIAFRFRQTPSAPMSTLSNRHSARTSITGRRLNFTKLSLSDPADIALPRLCAPNVR
jgi:hypothetical protein